MAQTEKQKMLAGELYLPSDPEIQADLAANKVWMVEYNAALAKSAGRQGIQAFFVDKCPRFGDHFRAGQPHRGRPAPASSAAIGAKSAFVPCKHCILRGL